MEHGLRAIIVERQESLIDFTKALVEIPTENPQESPTVPAWILLLTRSPISPVE